MKLASALLLAASVLATPATATEKYLGMPYDVIRKKMIEVGYTPVSHTSGCDQTLMFGDWRCSAWPELELCNFATPSMCVADWRRPSGGVVKVVIHGFNDPVYYTSGEPR